MHTDIGRYAFHTEFFDFLVFKFFLLSLSLSLSSFQISKFMYVKESSKILGRKFIKKKMYATSLQFVI